MQQNVNSSKVTKQWRVVAGKVASWVELTVYFEGRQSHILAANITGASPVYVEGLIERLNININTLLYELRRIPR